MPRPRPPRIHLAAALLAGLLVLPTAAPAQSPAPSADPPVASLTPELRQATIEAIADALIEGYIFEEVGREMAAAIRAKASEGDYSGLENAAGFAEALTHDLQAISNDKHLRVMPRSRVQRRQRRDPADFNWGFAKVEHLQGNVGLLDLRGFSHGPEAYARADAAFGMLANVDALIIDLRSNGGGGEDMLRYFSTYLFDEPTVLLTDETRDSGGPVDVITLEEVPGPRLADVPLFLLTSTRTFSAAEAFTFSMKINDRATIIGENTGGGGHYGGTRPINEQFAIWMPVGRAFDKRTGKGWEGTGIAPHIAASRDEALDVALEQARPVAQARSEARNARRREVMQQLQTSLAAIREYADADDLDAATDLMRSTLTTGLEAGVIEEGAINQLGYGELQHERFALAIAIFTFNVERYPESYNVYDSLGEAYMNSGQNDLAIANYEKSLELDPENDNAREMIKRMRDR